MSTEYIEREEKTKPLYVDINAFLEGENVNNTYGDYWELKEKLQALPAADVEPVVRGEWKDRCVRDWVCSLCGCEIQKIRYYDGYQYSGLPKFCPNCGAHMERSGDA